MSTFLIKNAKIVNEGSIFEGDLLIENEIISQIAESISPKTSKTAKNRRGATDPS